MSSDAGEAIVVAAHPDDEVLGASTVLSTRPCTVVFVTDGVVLASANAAQSHLLTPKRHEDGGVTGDVRVGEARAAHSVLAAQVAEYVRLGFGDQRVADDVVAVGDALARVVDAHGEADVYVPAYQGGHPDHDAVYVAAQCARARGTRPRRWFTYALYALDGDGRERFGWLDPMHYPDATTHGASAAERERKAVALRRFVSQLPDESVLAGWLRRPVPERYATLPTADAPLPTPRLFYEEIFQFSQFGIDAARIASTLQAAMERVRLV